MKLKTLICPLAVSAEISDLDAVIALCREKDLHLNIPLVQRDPRTPITGEPAVSEAWINELRAVRKETAARATSLERELNGQGLSADVQAAVRPYRQISSETGLRARYADLSVASASTHKDDGLRTQMLFGLLFESGRPVLVEPTGKDRTLTIQPDTVVIAWDGGVAASRAVMLAIPLLRSAKAVHVVCVDPQADDDVDEQAPGWDLAAYLARHQIEVNVAAVPSSGLSTDEAITRFAAEMGTQLIVMGAYGHSRLRERLFGGTSRAMLSNSKMPLFMAH